MGYFEQGEWKTGWYPSDSEGRFVRPPTTFRDQLTAGAVEKGRYHLYVSWACPWAHRTLIARELLGLHDYFSVGVVDWLLDDDGWAFRPEPEQLYGFSFLREAYLKAQADYTGRVTVPVLWDKQEERIINNESRQILRMMTTVFEQATLALSPQARRPEIDEILDAIYGPINNGVYRAGFATSQKAYDEAVGELFEALDGWDEVLARQPYLLGQQLSEADICMFTTLIRFDPVYFVHFKCSRRRIADYPHLSSYLRRLYGLEGFAKTCNFHHIRHHYYESHRRVNPHGIVAEVTQETIGLS